MPSIWQSNILTDEVKYFILNYEKDYKGDLYECVEANSIGSAYWS